MFKEVALDIYALFAIAGMSFAIGFSGAIMPGPLLTVVVNQAARRGFWWSFLAVVGHGIAEVAIVAALILGLGRLVVMPYVKAGIAIAGGAVLVIMAVMMFRSLSGLSLVKETEKDAKGGAVSIFHGIVASISNPYWIIWWATVGLALITKSWEAGLMGVGFFYVGHIMSDVVWYSAVGASISLNRRLMGDRVYRWIVLCCASALLGFGLYFEASGIKFII